MGQYQGAIATVGERLGAGYRASSLLRSLPRTNHQESLPLRKHERKHKCELPPPHTFSPAEHQEALQLLKYEHGQKYEAHNDYFHDAANAAPEHGGQRVATMLMYLTTAEEGGETVFPNAEEKSSGREWSACAKKGLAVKSIKGDALLFYR